MLTRSFAKELPHLSKIRTSHSVRVINSRRSFFKSWSSSSSSFNYSAQPNGHSADASVLGSVFKYNILVSYQPKDRDSEKGAIYQKLTKTNEMSPTGEDNYVVSFNKARNSVLIGVADGVGGWSELGYDSSAISRELCKLIKEQFEHDQVQDILVHSFDKVLSDKIVKVGGTTICIGIVDSSGKLYAQNLGDSWFGVFRPSPVDSRSKDIKYSCVMESLDQTHGFNTPYQLSIIPKEMQEESERLGRRYIQDTPLDADTYPAFQLESKDVVIFATDGVTDNVCSDDIAMFLTDEINKRNGAINDVALLNISKDFVGKVNLLSRDSKYPSVFAQNLSKLINQKYTGGKYDDITLVMLQVV